jgi:mercuric ion transport protein
MNNKLMKTGAIGTVLAAICCFTPLLVWVLGAIGLTSLVAYLDIVLLPLLGIFFIMLLVGLFLKFKNSKDSS